MSTEDLKFTLLKHINDDNDTYESLLLMVHVRKKFSFNLTLFRPGGGLLRPYQTLKLNNFKAVKAMTTKFSDFS